MKRYLYLLVALFVAGCVDKDIDLGNVQGNIGLTADKLTFPLAYMEEQSLDKLLGDTLEGVNVDSQTGDYSISYGADNQSIIIDGVANSFSIPGSVFKMDVDYPSFKLSDSKCVIDNTFDLNSKLGGLDLDFGHTLMMFPGLELAGSQQGSFSYMTDIYVPEYVESIERIYVSHDEGLPGAPMEVTFDLGSLGTVCGGGEVSLKLQVPEEYEIFDEQFNRLDDHIFQIDNRKIGAGVGVVKFTIYIGSIVNRHTAENGELHIPGDLSYEVSYKMTTQRGKLTFDKLPSLSIKTELACEDAEIVLGSIDLLPEQKFDNSIAIDAIDGIKSIKSIDLANSAITLFVDGLNWWEQDAVMAGALENLFVEMTMPDSFKFEPADKTVGFDSKTNTLRTSLAQLKRGLRLNMKQLNFGAEGLTPNSNGQIKVDLPISVRVALERGTKIRMKYLQHEGNVVVSAGYEDAQLTIAAVTGRVDFKYEESLSFDLAGADSMDGIEINGLGISPVIDFSLTNPLTVPLYVSAEISPKRGGVAAEGVKVDKLEILPATVGQTYTDVTPTLNRVRIGKNPTTESGVTTVDCDLEKLFNGSLPEQVAINLSVATNPDKDMSLVVLPSYPINYGYSFFLPLAFGTALDLSYTGVAEGIGQTVGELDIDISATGTISLLCDIENSTPLNLALEIQMFDKSGKPTSLQIKSGKQNVIKGSADGITPCKSSLVFTLSSSSKKNLLDGLKDIETLKYTLRATSAADGVSLNCNQTISGTFALEVDGNVNINVDNLM